MCEQTLETNFVFVELTLYLLIIAFTNLVRVCDDVKTENKKEVSFDAFLVSASVYRHTTLRSDGLSIGDKELQLQT